LSEILEKALREISQQKQKYHEKLLSTDGEWSTFMRSFQLWDFMIDISSLLIPEFYFATMSLGLLFDFDLFTIEPLNLEFTWRYPTVDEWLKGVGVVIEKTIPPTVTNVETFVTENVKVEYQPAILETRLEKGYYGKTRYGYCYYDPLAVREFVRNAISLMIKKHPSWVQRKQAILSLASSLGVSEDLARYIHDRMSMVMSAHVEDFILDYGMLDVSYLCVEEEHSPEYTTVPFVNLDGEVQELEVYNMTDLQYGFILDFSYLDVDYLCDDVDAYKDVAPAIDVVDENLKKFRDRIMITAPAFSNYVRGDEAVDHSKCERTNIYGELLAMRYSIESEVDAFLKATSPQLPAFERRKYISAVLQLWGHKGKRHEWGFKTFKYMNLDELKSWWVDYWSRQGLDPALLDRLFEMVKTWLPDVVDRKVELGRKLRLERLGIPID
jgi:hypothetical protein